MLQNKIYDILIIGATESSIRLYKKLIKKQDSILVVDSGFAACRRGMAINKKDRLYGIVLYANFNYGLLNFTITNNQVVFCKQAVYASNTSFKKINFSAKNLYYTARYSQKDSKTVVCILGCGQLACEAALQLAKKYKYVYLCGEKATLTASKNTKIAITMTQNIVFLPRCHLKNCIIKYDRIESIELSTFTQLKTDALLVLPEPESNLNLFAELLNCAEQDLVIDTQFQLTALPKVYCINNLILSNNQLNLLKNKLINKEF